jgi:hypothetical protein
MVKSFWDKYGSQRAAQRSVVELRRQRGTLRARPPVRRRAAPTKR